MKGASRPGSGTGPDGAPPGVDLLVVEGADAGKRFTCDGPVILVGRALPDGVGIGLQDSSVAPRHVALRPDGETLRVELLDRRSSLFINGETCERGAVKPGDRLQIGSVVIEVRPHRGMSLREILKPLPSRGSEEASPPLRRSDRRVQEGPFDEPGEDTDACQTLLRPVSMPLERGAVTVLQGAALVNQTRFELDADVTTLGRAHGSDIEVADRSVSRAHAEFVWEAEALVLIQKSPANFTFVNGERVTVSRTLCEGDKIQIADVLVLRVEGLAQAPAARPAENRFGDLGRAMEARLRLEQQIEEEFKRRGSMLDVDVAGSSEMKQGTHAAHIILSFERFRDYVANTVREFGGVVLNSNGDELMCFFEDTYAAVRAGSAILERLDAFNAEENLLPRPFRFRIGIHTGDCLVDLQSGRAFSPLVDLAGHLQKQADVNGLLISETTLAALPPGLPFEPAGALERHAIATYRLTRFV